MGRLHLKYLWYINLVRCLPPSLLYIGVISAIKSPLKKRKRTKSATVPPNPAIMAISIEDKVFAKSESINTPSVAVEAETYKIPARKEPRKGVFLRLRKKSFKKLYLDKKIVSKILIKMRVRPLYL